MRAIAAPCGPALIHRSSMCVHSSGRAQCSGTGVQEAVHDGAERAAGAARRRRAWSWTACSRPAAGRARRSSSRWRSSSSCTARTRRGRWRGRWCCRPAWRPSRWWRRARAVCAGIYLLIYKHQFVSTKLAHTAWLSYSWRCGSPPGRTSRGTLASRCGYHSGGHVMPGGVCAAAVVCRGLCLCRWRACCGLCLGQAGSGKIRHGILVHGRPDVCLP